MVITIIGILISLLLPAVQAAREAARRLQCSNNLKQIGLGLLNYECTHSAFPAGGGLKAGTGSAYGYSWWVSILPYIEQNNIYDKLDQTNPLRGWTPCIPANAALLKNVQFSFMYCPSSTLPPIAPAPEVMSATYTGISGSNYKTPRQAPPSGSDITVGAATGIISSDGVLVVGRCTAISSITDGTTNTMIVGEQSDFLVDENGNPVSGCSDCGHGFPMGPVGYDERRMNLTCVRYGINDKFSDNTGVAGNCGPNTPIQSSHSGGANVLFADGSVQFLNETLSLDILRNLADRNDGAVTGF